MSQAQAYKQAISIITSNPDWKEIVIRIAQNNPSIICQVAGDPSYANKRQYLSINDQEACNLLESDGIVSAIKHVRSGTGMGLKEAKHHVEALEAKFNLRRPMSNHY